MTGVTYIKNTSGEKTHVILDLTLYGDVIESIIYDEQDIQTIKSAQKEETIDLKKTIDELAKQGVLSKEALKKIANV